jgi:hypothetical protein
VHGNPVKLFKDRKQQQNRRHAEAASSKALAQSHCALGRCLVIGWRISLIVSVTPILLVNHDRCCQSRRRRLCGLFTLRILHFPPETSFGTIVRVDAISDGESEKSDGPSEVSDGPSETANFSAKLPMRLA